MPAQHRLHAYASLTAVATFLLLIAGGLVTSTGSGLAVPDWPLSYGMWFPPMVGGILYEHGHRMAAAVVGLMILGLAIWLGWIEPRRWVRRLGYTALAAVIIQALLGGLTVLLLLPPAVSVAHACLGQAVFCLVVCVARGTAPDWADQPDPRGAGRLGAVRRCALIVATLAAVQLLLGAIVRHTGYAVFPHIGVALVLLLGIVACLAAARGLPRECAAMRWAVWRLGGLIGLQVVIGLSVFLHRGSVALRTAHVAIGALLLAQAIVLAWEAVRRMPRRSSAVRPAPSVAGGEAIGEVAG